MKRFSILLAVMFCISGASWAACPTMDFTGDCQVNLADLAIFAGQWLNVGTLQPNLTWVTINDSGAGMKDIGGGPVNEGGFVGQMSKYETTNAQYCEFLNAQFDNDLITVVNFRVHSSTDTSFAQPYYYLNGLGETTNGAVNGGASRIHLSHKRFVVDSGFENHPVTYVTWWGAMAFANYYGWRLPTEWEWQAAADYDGTYTYGCETLINTSLANFTGSTHPNGTTAVGTFGQNGYGLCDMSGNAAEWTSSLYMPMYYTIDRVLRGGGWSHDEFTCRVSYRNYYCDPIYKACDAGFRVCR